MVFFTCVKSTVEITEEILGIFHHLSILLKAFYRCGRFDKVVYIPLPDYTSRRELLLRKMTSADDVTLGELVRRTNGHSHAEVSTETIRWSSDGTSHGSGFKKGVSKN